MLRRGVPGVVVVGRRGFGSQPAASARPITWARLAGLGLVSASLLASYNYIKTEKYHKFNENKTIGKPMIGGPFQLVDSHGALVRRDDFQGRYALLYFGFTHCPDLCPTEMTKITKAIELIDEARGPHDAVVTPVFISVDPHRDTPAVLNEYRKDYHERLVALTGSIAEITAVAKRYRVYFSAPEGEDDDYMVDHSLFAYLLGKDGSVEEIFGRDLNAEEIAAKVATIIIQDRANQAAIDISISGQRQENVQ